MKKHLLTIILLACLKATFCQTITEQKPTVVKLAETTKSWNGDLLPSYSKDQPKITILKITIPAHSKLAIHKHLVINAGVLTKGALTVVDDKNNVLELKAGDAIVELVNTYHYGENKSDEPAEIIVFYAGTVDTPITMAQKGESDH